MSTDLGTTARKPLTPAGRLALFELRKGLCACCGRQIQPGEGWIDEHWRALGLSGTNDVENRFVAHKACAADKTHGPDGDLAKIAKAKRTKRAHLGIKGKPSALSGPDHAEKREIREARSKNQRGDRLPTPSRRIWPGFESAGSARR